MLSIAELKWFCFSFFLLSFHFEDASDWNAHVCWPHFISNWHRRLFRVSWMHFISVVYGERDVISKNFPIVGTLPFALTWVWLSFSPPSVGWIDSRNFRGFYDSRTFGLTILRTIQLYICNVSYQRFSSVVSWRLESKKQKLILSVAIHLRANNLNLILLANSTSLVYVFER